MVKKLVMTRFSNPKTIMRFLKDSDSLAYIPTPMGMQEFIIQTNRYQVDGQKDLFRLSITKSRGTTLCQLSIGNYLGLVSCLFKFSLLSSRIGFLVW